MESAMFSKQPLRCNHLFIQYVHERISILGQRRCEYGDFVVFRHFMQELSATRPHHYVYIADSTFYVYWQDYVRIFRWLERRMHEGFV